MSESPTPPCDESTLTIRNAPGPVLKKSIVVSTPGTNSPCSYLPQHDGGGSQWSISCSQSTATGAAPTALPSTPARAAAVARTSTELRPNSWAKNPGEGRSVVTSTVSFGRTVVRNLTFFASSPPSFVAAYSSADASAAALLSGKSCAAASAAASALA